MFVKRKISAVRFIDGGAPIFPASMIKSQRDIAGEMHIIPLEIIMLRVFVDSYIEFAREKRPEDARPCATIMTRAPIIPQVDLSISPAMRRAI